MLRAQRLLDLAARVGFARARDNPGTLQPVVRGQGLEQIDHRLKELRHFLGRLVIGIALGIEGGDACAVLVPLMGPETVGGTLIASPVLLHVVQ